MGQRLAWVFPKEFLRIATNSYKGLYERKVNLMRITRSNVVKIVVNRSESTDVIIKIQITNLVLRE